MSRLPHTQALMSLVPVDADERLSGPRRFVAHSNPALQGSRLQPGWYERVLNEAGDDVVETRFAGLTEGERAFDVRLPITYRGATVGTYHAGISSDWFEATVAAQQDDAQFGWMVVIRQTTALQHRLDLSEVRRVNELRQFIVGLAHEVRNPLNAIRLNLHAIGRVHHDEAGLPAEEVSTILRESTREIGRVTALIGEMLGYARSDELYESGSRFLARLPAAEMPLEQEILPS